MTSYQEITRKVATSGSLRSRPPRTSIVKLAENLNDARGKVELPDFPVPEALTKLNEALSERLPKPSEVVEANFELTSRLLTAQRDLTLRLLEVSGRAAVRARPPRQPAKKTAKKESDLLRVRTVRLRPHRGERRRSRRARPYLSLITWGRGNVSVGVSLRPLGIR